MSWHWSVSLVSCVPSPWLAALPQPGEASAGFVREDGGAGGDACLRRVGLGDFDDVDAEERGAVVARHVADAAGQLLFLADTGGAGVVDHDTVLVLEHHRMRVRPAAGLHLADLARAREVGDVEDAQAAEALVAHVLGHALTPAVDAAARLFHGHDQEIADDGDIALSAGTDHRAEQGGRLGIGEAVDVEAVVVAGHQHVTGERHVGLREGEQRGPFAPFGALIALAVGCDGLGFLVLLLGLGERHIRRVGRIEEAGGLAKRSRPAPDGSPPVRRP